MNNSTINLILNILIVIVFVAIVFLSMGSTRDTETFFDNEKIFYTMGEKGSEVKLPCDRSYCDRISIPEYSPYASRDGFRLGIGPLPYGYHKIPKDEGLMSDNEKVKDPTKNYTFLTNFENKILNDTK